MILNKIAQLLKRKFQKQIDHAFEKEEAPDRSKWQPRKLRKSNHKILQKTGRLKKSFNVTTSKNKVHVKSNVGYGQYHQQGTNQIPQRKIVGWSDEFEKEIVKDLEKLVLNEVL